MGHLSAALITQDQPNIEDFELDQLLELNWWTDQLVPTVARVALIIAFSLVFRWVLIRMVNRLVHSAKERRETGSYTSSRDQITAERKSQRAATLGTLFKNMISVIVLTMMSLMVLSEVGINLAPLLAGVGVIGLAIGFGAQALVQDMVSGIFILMEDQYGVGDVVDVGDATGTVEEVQLRITKLRSIDGTLWFVRNGEIMRVGNMSQDYSKVVLDVGIGYGSDIDLARTVLERVAQEFAEHPETQDVLETPQVLGVQELGADSVVMRLVLTTKPGEQWSAARSLQERIKKAFDEDGIEIPFPQRTLWLRKDDDDAASELEQ